MSDGYHAAYPVFSQSSAHPHSRSEFYQAQQPDLADKQRYALSDADKKREFKAILDARLHGLSFSPYLDGQSPGVDISAQQIRDRLAIIAPYTNWIRTFSCTEGNELTPAIAHDMGLRVMVGIGVGDDEARNEQEYQNGIRIARQGHADILAVGNEVLLRGDLSEDALLELIERAKADAPGVPVGYVDAYFLFENHPRIAAACDVLLINCYPFWESCPAEYSLLYMKEMYRRAVNVAGGKKVIISETGWPDRGSAFGAAEPGFDNALTYFINACRWAEEDGIELFYFSSFDESWKTGSEGDVGAYWGLWDTQGQLKYE